MKMSKIITNGGIRVGLFGLTTNMKPAHDIAYVDEFLDPLTVAEVQAHTLRQQGAEVCYRTDASTGRKKIKKFWKNWVREAQI